MKNIFLILFSIFLITQSPLAHADNELIATAYKDYVSEARYYVQALKDVDNSLRDWRQKKLAETFDTKLSVIEKNLSLSNDNLIEEFNKFLKTNGVKSLDDVLMIRLAQLYFERSNLNFNHEMKEFQRQHNSKANLPEPNYDKTIRIAKKFLEAFPQSPIGDKALYILGYCFEETEKSPQAEIYYKQLLTQFPVSEYADEVMWRLAEIYYSQSKYVLAENLYAGLAKNKGPYFTKAIYKLGASQFERKDFLSASKTFQKLIQEIGTQNLTDLEDISLLDEAKDYLATILTQKSSVKISESLMPELFYRMGQLYKKRLDEKSMRTVYIAATSKYTDSKFMPQYYSELIDSFDNAGSEELANKYRSSFVQFLTDNQKWWGINDEYKKTIFQTQDLLEYNLLKSAEFYADKGYRKKDISLLKIAKSRYSNFITKYSWSPYHDTALLELGDLEYYLGNYADASNDYYQVANNAESDLLREEAAYSLIWSEVKKVGYDLNFETKNINFANIKKTNFDSKENAFIHAALFYVDKIKTSFRKDKILYKLSEIYVEHAKLDEASIFLNSIISDQDYSSATTASAYKFLAAIYNQKGNASSLTSIRELYHTTLFGADIEVLNKANYRQRYREKIEDAVNLEMKEQYAKAAQAFEKVSLQNADSSLNNYLNFKILDLYMKAAQFDRVENYLSAVKNGPYKAEALFMKAFEQYQLSRFESSAQLFEEFSFKYKNNPWYMSALLNAINLRRQLNQPEKVLQLVQSAKLSSANVLAAYDRLDALMELKKYDEVYRSVSFYRKSKILDDFYLESYVIKAELERNDISAAEKNCAAVKNIFDQSKIKTTNLIYDQSLCEFLKIKVLNSQSQTTLKDIVSQLNKIYSLKNDEVTLMAVNEIVQNSPLKEANKIQFGQLLDKGWSIARKYPFAKQTKILTKNFIKEKSQLPISLAYLLNWNISFADMLDFKPVVSNDDRWPKIKQDCDSKSYGDCLKGLESLYETTPNQDIIENILVASLKAQDDRDYQEFLLKYAAKNENLERAKAWTVLTSNSSEDILVNSDSDFSIVAKNVSDFARGDRGRAIDGLTKMISANAKFAMPYLFLARMYYSLGRNELALHVLENGYKNSGSSSLLASLYQINALVYSSTNYSDSGGNQDKSPAIQFAIAFSALKNQDRAQIEDSLRSVQGLKNWSNMIRSAQNLYLDSKEFKTEKSTSNYVTWLQDIYELSRGNFGSLEKLKGFATEKGFSENFAQISQGLSARAIATDGGI